MKVGSIKLTNIDGIFTYIYILSKKGVVLPTLF